MKNSDIYDSNSPIYIFHYEYYNTAWIKKHYGSFKDSYGNIFTYNMPEKWNPYQRIYRDWNSEYCLFEIDGMIHRKELMQNLDISNKSYTGRSTIDDFNVKMVVKEFMNTAYTQIRGGCDAGIHAYTILIYDITVDMYRRFMIKTEGDHHMVINNEMGKNMLLHFHDMLSIKTESTVENIKRFNLED